VYKEHGTCVPVQRLCDKALDARNNDICTVETTHTHGVMQYMHTFTILSANTLCSAVCSK